MSVQEEEDHYSVQLGESNNGIASSVADGDNRKDVFYDDEDAIPYPAHIPKDVTVVDFFHAVMNNGAADNVICFKMIVFLILLMSALIIGNAAFIFTTEDINTDFLTEVSSIEASRILFWCYHR
jgi:hypothetical protein